jgi:hypothetical protein
MPIFEVLIGGVIGVAGALGGTWLQNRHDSKQRERERQMALRRDVYLQAAEGLAGLQEYLAGISDTSRSMTDLAQVLRGVPGWQNKIHTVASLETITAFAEADRVFIAGCIAAIPHRYAIDQVDRRMAALEDRATQLRQYQSYLHTSLQAQLPQFPSKEAVATASQIRQAIDFVQRQIDDLEEQHCELASARSAQIRQLFRGTIGRVAEYRQLTGKALLAIRQEIDLPLDPPSYLGLLDRTNKDVMGALQRVIAEEEEPIAISPESAS